MAQHYFNGGNHNHRRAPTPMNNQIVNDNYDVELMKLMERERQYQTTQHRSPTDGVVNNLQQTQYLPAVNDIYTASHHRAPTPQFTRRIATPQINQRVATPQINQRVATPLVNQRVATPMINRRSLPPTSAILPGRLPGVNPLRIIVIRHAERVDAVLGSDWSKKSFDRAGRYVRFSEHLPESLPHRSYLHHYVIDVPLTNRGRMHAFKTGKSLLTNGYGADVCYTSPSLRCVQSADGILTGMGRKAVPMQLEPGLFECYLNDFKRTLCFMTKDELLGNGYNIDPSYQPLMPFMRPHDSQLDYYERSRVILDTIAERHQATGGTILVVAHAPSLEGLTRHLSGGKLQPEKLFDIARRVPFLAMTIIEKNGIDGPWLFRTQPLQAGPTLSTREGPLELAALPPPTPTIGLNSSMIQHGQQQLQLQYQQQKQQRPPLQDPQQQQRLQQIENLRNGLRVTPIPMDPKKVVKSSTAPNLRTSHSLSEMFRVI